MNPPVSTIEQQHHSTRSWTLMALSVVVTLASLGAALWGIDWGQVGQTLVGMNQGPLLLAVLSVVLTLLVKALRWRFLLGVGRQPSFVRSFAVLNIGLLLNSFLPARLGDAARVYLLGVSEAESPSLILGTIVVEKISDLFGILVALLVLFAAMPLPEWLIVPARTASGILFAAGGGLFLLSRIGRVRWLPIWLTEPLAKLAVVGPDIVQPRRALGLFVWSLVVTLLGASTNWLVFQAVGLTQISAWAAIFLLVVILLGVAVPSTPGRFGVFHYLTIVGLMPFGIAKETALSCGIILHLCVYLPNVLLGGYYLWREQVPWLKLEQRIMRQILHRGSAQ